MPPPGGMIENLPSLRIGPVVLDRPFVLGALAGYTDMPYRLLCRRLGALYCVTEMMLDRQLLLPGTLRRRLVHLSDEDHPVGGQIVGNDPEVMSSAAVELSRSGFDVVDVNCACPVRKVLARRRGGYLLKRPDLALEIIRAVAARSDRPVTVKLRSGFHAGDAGGDAFWRIAEGAFDAGAAALCVHARTVEQRYTGRADWEFLAEVKRRFSDRTILGSGDVSGPPEAVAMLRQTGVDGAVLARAAIGNPWIFRQLEDYIAGREAYRPPLGEQRALLEEHFARAMAVYGPRRGPKRMRKFGIKYARMHPRPAKVRAAFVAVKSPHDWQQALDKHYASDA